MIPVRSDRSIAILIGLGVCVALFGISTGTSAQGLEEIVSSIEGTADLVFLDDFERGRSSTRVVLHGDDGTIYPLELETLLSEHDATDRVTADFAPGDRISVTGHHRDGALQVLEITRPPSDMTGRRERRGGEQRTVVLLVNSYENVVEPITTTGMWDLVFAASNPWSVTNYFLENSYGKSWVTGDVFGWYTLPLTEDQLCNDYNAVLAAAIEAADPDVYYPDYFRLMILFPDAGCYWGGLGNSGLVWFSTDDGNVQMSWSQYNSVAQFGGTSGYGGSSYHELGHNFGCGHGNDWECGEVIMGGPDCESINYGDDFDAMGRAGAKGHFNALHKEVAGWFDPGQVLETTGPGVYVLEPIETDTGGLKALKIPAAGGLTYYVEYRRSIGFDAHLFDFYPADHDGAMIRIDHEASNGDSQLLDMTPHWNSGSAAQLMDSLFSVLGVGDVFQDQDSNIVITTIAVGEEALVVRLGLHTSRLMAALGPSYGNPPSIGIFPPEQDAMAVHQFPAYAAPHFGANVAVGRTGSGWSNVILTGPGPGAIYGPHIRGFDVDGTPVPGLNFLAYGTHKYGVNVSAGDLDGDGYDEIITGAGPGRVFGPHVRAFDFDGGNVVSPIAGVSYFAYGTHKYGVNVAAGDLDGDGFDEIITGAGPGTVFGPHVRGWAMAGGSAAPLPGVNFMAYGTYRYGVRVSCGDVDGDGMDEIITAPGPSAAFGAHIRGWNCDGSEAEPVMGLNFFAWAPSESRYGATIHAGTDLNGDARDEIVVGMGPDPSAGPLVAVFTYDGEQPGRWISFDAFPGDHTHGAVVAAGIFDEPAEAE